jgi:uncharacterized membrane protein
MTQDFLPRFTCFPASYFSVWRCTHLMDHELIDYQESNPQQVPHIHSQDGILQATSSTRVANSRTPAGKAQEPLTITWWGSKQSPITSTTSPLLQAIYDVGKHPIVTRNPQPTQGSSATRCKSLSNALESHSISLEYATKQRDEWRGSSLAQSMSQVFKESRSSSQTRPSNFL